MLSKSREHGLELTPRQVDSLLETTAIDRGLPGKDNDYGAGLISALAAVVATPSVVAISDREQAIAWAQGKHIVRNPGTRELHVVYQASGGVYWSTSSDDGFSWSTAELVAPGANPCINLDFKGLPWVAYSSEENGWRRRLYCAVRRPNGTWTKRLVHQDPGAHFGAPSLVCSNWRNDAVPYPPPPDMGYLVVQGIFQSGISSRVLFIPLDTLHSNPDGMYNYAVVDLSSSTGMDAGQPCISRTPGDYVHVTWRGVQHDGTRRTYYQTCATDPALIRGGESPAFTAAHPVSDAQDLADVPVNDAYSDFVTGLWRAEEMDEGSIHEKHRHVYRPPHQWSEVEPWSEGSLEAGFPAMSRCAGVWQQQPQSEFPDGVVCRFAVMTILPG